VHVAHVCLHKTHIIQDVNISFETLGTPNCFKIQNLSSFLSQSQNTRKYSPSFHRSDLLQKCCFRESYRTDLHSRDFKSDAVVQKLPNKHTTICTCLGGHHEYTHISPLTSRTSRTRIALWKAPSKSALQNASSTSSLEALKNPPRSLTPSSCI